MTTETQDTAANRPTFSTATDANLCDFCGLTIFRGDRIARAGQGVNGASSGTYHAACAPMPPAADPVAAVLALLEASDAEPSPRDRARYAERGPFTETAANFAALRRAHASTPEEPAPANENEADQTAADIEASDRNIGELWLSAGEPTFGG